MYPGFDRSEYKALNVHICGECTSIDKNWMSTDFANEGLLWGFVNTLHAQIQRLDRAVDRLTSENSKIFPDVTLAAIADGLEHGIEASISGNAHTQRLIHNRRFVA